MDKCCQKSTKSLENEVINTVLDNVNTAICFYKNRPSTVMKLSLEETIIDNVPFAELVANRSEQGAMLLEQLEKLSDKVIGCLPIFKLEIEENNTENGLEDVSCSECANEDEAN